ncbi:MAG: hypothetical protein WCO68_06500 [Verrucomicrobiota bacterium]
MSNDPIHFTQEEWMELRVKFSYLKHSTNNTLAVFLSLAELAQSAPENYEMLAQSVCARTLEIVELSQAVSTYLDTKGPRPAVS